MLPYARISPSATITAWELTEPTSIPTAMSLDLLQSRSGFFQLDSGQRQNSCFVSSAIAFSSHANPDDGLSTLLFYLS
jgi:hypothetical protein